MKISVFIPILLYSDDLKDMTVRCIRQARENTSIPFELILLENKTWEFKDDADIYIHTDDYNHYSRNANICRGAAYNSDYVVGMGNDAFMPIDWLEALLECYDKVDCGFATLNSSEHNLPCSNDIIESTGGAVFMESRKFIDKVGDWDEGYINSFEDADLWIRGLMQGYRVYKNMRVLVEHLGGQTWKCQQSHNDNFNKNRKRFNDKFRGCKYPLFTKLR